MSVAHKDAQLSAEQGEGLRIRQSESASNQNRRTPRMIACLREVHLLTNS